MHDNESADHYRPPEPPPIAVKDPITAIALIGVIGAPLVFVIIGILLTYEPTRLGLICVFVFVASFGVLFFRSKNRPAKADDWDDGAVL